MFHLHVSAALSSTSTWMSQGGKCYKLTKQLQQHSWTSVSKIQKGTEGRELLNLFNTMVPLIENFPSLIGTNWTKKNLEAMMWKARIYEGWGGGSWSLTLCTAKQQNSCSPDLQSMDGNRLQAVCHQCATDWFYSKTKTSLGWLPTLSHPPPWGVPGWVLFYGREWAIKMQPGGTFWSLPVTLQKKNTTGNGTAANFRQHIFCLHYWLLGRSSDILTKTELSVKSIKIKTTPLSKIIKQ